MNCHEITRLLSDALEAELSSDDRTYLTRHLERCPACRICEQQFGWIRRTLRALAGES